MSKKRVLKGVPDDAIERVVADLKSEGCKVSKKKEANGKWTVTAVCPD